MQVGVEDAVVQRLGQEGAGQVVGQRLAVQARLVQRRGSESGRPVGPLHGQHPLADARPRPPWARPCSRPWPSPRPARRRRRPRAAGPAPARWRGSPSRRTAAAPAAAPAAPSARPAARPAPAPRSRRATRRSMPGRSTFTATRRPSSSVAVVRLGQRGGGHRLAEARRTRLSTGRPSSRSTSARATSVGNGGSRSFRWPRSSAKVAPEDVGAGGQELAELDRHRPQPLQRPRQPLARPALRAARPANSRSVAGQRRARPADRGRRARAAAGRRCGPASSRRPISRAKAPSAAMRLRSPSPVCRAATPPVKLVQPTWLKPASPIMRGEGRLVGEAADALDQVLVGLPVARPPARRSPGSP